MRAWAAYPNYYAIMPANPFPLTCLRDVAIAAAINIREGKTMANRDDKVPENVPGRYYVDTQCIDCNLCRDMAPNNFAHQEEAGYAYVSRQPNNEDEEGLCGEAKDSCPVEAIGDDGE